MIKMTIQEAISLFDSGEYKEAFEGFAGIYNDSNDPQERVNIMSILQEAYYQPNEFELRECYEKNRNALAKYPYIWGDKLAEFSSLSFLLFPTSEESYYLYDKITDQFIGMYDGTTRHQMRYFFENLDHALKVEDEDNLYNLTFLFDNVRRSEDVAMDNHIYLLYSSWEPLQRVMQVGDLSPVLKYKKFVFLEGEHQYRYPVDFKTEFGIDYDSMEPQKLRIDEMKRICYWWKRGYSGSSFSLNVLNQNSHIIMKEIWMFLLKTEINGKPLFLTHQLKDVTSDVNKTYSMQELKDLFENKSVKLHWIAYSDFWKWWEHRYTLAMKVTLPQFLRAYFIYLYEKQKPKENPRIVPTFLFEPHLNDQTIFTPIVLTFPYRTVMNCIRDPIQTAGRIYQREGNIFIYSDYALTLNMHKDLKVDYYVHRFEDLKLYPKETALMLCRILNIPFEDNMLSSSYSEEEIIRQNKNGNLEKTGKLITGFDLTPLYRQVDDVFSEFDQIRLRIFYDFILRHYGYPRFNFDECPMNDQDIYFLLKFPFRCEADYVAREKEHITPGQLRERLYKNMCLLWTMAKEGKIFLPKVIKPRN